MGLKSAASWTMVAALLLAVPPAWAEGEDPERVAVYVGVAAPIDAGTYRLQATRVCWSAEGAQVNTTSDACWEGRGASRAGTLPDVVRIVGGIVFGVVVAGNEVCVLVEDGSVQGCTAVCQREASLPWCGEGGSTLP